MVWLLFSVGLVRYCSLVILMSLHDVNIDELGKRYRVGGIIINTNMLHVHFFNW